MEAIALGNKFIKKYYIDKGDCEAGVELKKGHSNTEQTRSKFPAPTCDGCTKGG